MCEKRNARNAGITLGLLSSATFGLIPLFTLPLLQAGISAQTALVYRFAIATAAMWAILAIRGEKYGVSWKDALKLMVLSAMYLFAVVLFFYSFSFIASGAVVVIQFLYTVMVMLIMVFFFHEKFRLRMALAVILAVAGVAVLSTGPDLESVIETGDQSRAILPWGSNVFWGITLSLLAGLGNALYFVGIQVAKIPNINGLVMTFYVMLFGTGFCFINALACNSLQWITGFRELGLAFLLAIVTAVISNLALIIAIKHIGSTMTSILGVMEPLTAVVVGILVFGEPLTTQLICSIFLIVGAVLLVVLNPAKKKHLQKEMPQ